MSKIEIANRILEVTEFLNSAIRAEDLVVISDLLSTREELMISFDSSKDITDDSIQAILRKVHDIDVVNNQLMLQMKSRIDQEGLDVRSERNRVSKSTKATKKYIQPDSVNISTFNKKR